MVEKSLHNCYQNVQNVVKKIDYHLRASENFR